MIGFALLIYFGMRSETLKKSLCPRKRDFYKSKVNLVAMSSAGVITLSLTAPAVFGIQYFEYYIIIYCVYQQQIKTSSLILPTFSVYARSHSRGKNGSVLDV